MKCLWVFILILFITPFQNIDCAELRDVRIHAFAQSHIDAEWMWPWQETIEVCKNTFEGVLDIMDRDPEFQYNQNSAAFYDAVEKNYPRTFERIKEAVKRRRWNVVGGKWVESSISLCSGESLIRQYLYGKRYFREKFGIDVNIDWQMEGSDYPVYMPQVLNKCGMKYLVVGRGFDPKINFMDCTGWADASVLTAVIPSYFLEWEVSGPNMENYAREALEILNGYPLKDIFFIYGAGDHGSVPLDIDNVRKLSRSMRDPEIIRTTSPLEYFELIEKKGSPVKASEMNLSLLNTDFGGIRTTLRKVKEGNGKGENLLTSAEIFSSMLSSLKLKTETASVEQLYKTLLIHQHHDPAGGSLAYSAYENILNDYRKIEQECGRIITDTLNKITSQINTKGEGIPVAVFNPLPWQRTDVASIDPEEMGSKYPADSEYAATDNSGHSVPVQHFEKKLIFVAEDVPAAGYKVYWLKKTGKDRDADRERPVILKNGILRNRFYEITIDLHTGTVEKIYDRVNETTVTGKSNVLQIHNDKGDVWQTKRRNKTWNSGSDGNAKIHIEEGSVRSAFIIENDSFTQRIILYRGIPRVEFQLHGKSMDKRKILSVKFSPRIKNGVFSTDLPLGYEEIKNGGLIFAHKWLDVSGNGGEGGLSFLTDLKYSFICSGRNVEMMMVRTPSFLLPWGENRYPKDIPRYTDTGEFSARYALYPHKNGWRDAGVIRKGHEFNYPLYPVVCSPGEGDLAPARSFLSIDNPNVVLSCWKQAEDGSGDSILRIYESAGEKSKVNIKLPCKASGIYETNLLEDTGKESALFTNDSDIITKQLMPHEIVTFRIKL